MTSIEELVPDILGIEAYWKSAESRSTIVRQQS